MPIIKRRFFDERDHISCEGRHFVKRSEIHILKPSVGSSLLNPAHGLISMTPPSFVIDSCLELYYLVIEW